MKRIVGRLGATLLAIGAVALAQCQKQQPQPQPGQLQVDRATLAAARLALGTGCEEEVPPERKAAYAPALVSASALDNRLLHDCQKLLVNRDTYGPLVAVLAIDSIDEKIANNAMAGMVLADVIDYDAEPYERLNIQPGIWQNQQNLNCLWIQGDPAKNPNTWHAEMRQGAGCRNASGLTVGDSLEIHAIPYARDAAHPPTARWGWSAQDQVQFIGIHCGRYWCEIGPKGFHGSVGNVGDRYGLGDQQYLAWEDSATGKARPTHVWGRIEPDPILATADSTQLKTPLAVARITLGADADDPPGGPTNAVVLAHYRQLFHVPVDTTSVLMWYDKGNYNLTSHANGNNHKWKAAKRCPWKHAVVGAARWAWSSSDEGLWLPCSDGCCTAAGLN